MRLVLALAGLFACGTSAWGSPSPLPPPLTHLTSADAINLGPAGAMLEADYFSAHQPGDSIRDGGHFFPCRPRLHIAARSHRPVQTCK